jgi:ABC-type sugar transport system ATPase subunit
MSEPSDILLEMKGISKAYRGNQALRGVSLEVRRGEVHALMGENGAGKSTLMKVLTGLVRPDEGAIRMGGREVRIDSPQTARKLGIAMIHQELSPIPAMTIAENIFLGREPTYPFGFFLDDRRLTRRAGDLLRQFEVPLDPDMKVGRLSVAQKQMLEIIKPLSDEARLIIMDEPTSALSEGEVKTLFRMIGRLKERGVPVIYISHRLEEIFRISDRVTVLRDGQVIGTEPTARMSAPTLISMMVGRSIDDVYPKAESRLGDVVFEARNLTGRPFFQDISFQVRAGEILGIGGLMGAGRSEVMRAIFGLDRLDSGELRMEGSRVTIRRPADAIRQGIAMVTEDRKELGLVLCRSIQENMTLVRLPRMNRGPFLSGGAEKRLCQELAGKLRLDPGRLNRDVGSLSGGNQQKVVLAKWLMARPRLLILDEPTRGIDVGAKAEIYTMISALAKEGLAILMISSEMPELIGMSDRILVMGRGRIRGEFARGRMTQEEILKCALEGSRVA